ncbi:MAG TPA: carotenoid oxygenase family protein [Gammaproteobacteria bacterium]|nr:carotenoid oxygenase family protein [Gammaproteobacteria bacterium]HIL98820.1 carotenoid oxygenase family protein [Pseudomonadales bacterium]
MECDARDLIIEGEIPADLHGTFFRNGPNPQFAPRGQYHWFGGDGMIHAFHIENGKVSYKNRWAKTVKFKTENNAGRSLFSAFNPMDSDPDVAGLETDGLANTNIVWHGGKLLALEEGHAPFELDPVTLESRGAWKFDESLVGPMTAHPKIDPETGEMIFFGYSVDGMLSNKMSYHVVGPDGKLQTSQFFDAPYAAMVHDFMVTRDYVLFPIMPLTGSLERAMEGKPAFAWEPEMGNQIGVMRRGGSVDDIRWFTSEATFVFHPMNAFNDGDVITCDVSEYDRAPLFPNPDGSEGSPSGAKLTRWTLDLGQNTNDYVTRQLDDVSCEFGRLDERFTGLSYRYGYMLCDGKQPGDAGGFNAIARVDHQQSARETFEMPPEMATSEAVFVPKSGNAGEGEGYLLSNVYDATIDKSHLVILDAQNLSQGPLARAYLDHRVPFGFHGNWMPGSG